MPLPFLLDLAPAYSLHLWADSNSGGTESGETETGGFSAQAEAMRHGG